MTQRLGFRWLVLVVIAALLGGLGIAAAQDAPHATRGEARAQGGAPSVVSYQGQVTVSGIAYSGPGYFKFAIVNQSGGTSYWSNDGTATGGGQPTNAVTLTVSTGLFNVLLGDTTLDYMTALPASVFSGTERWLRVWFSSDGSNFVQLSPDRRIAAVPYALQAEDAGTLGGLDGSAYQLRVSGACAQGSTIRTVNADGTVECEAHDSRPVYTRTAVDTEGYVGLSPSITVGADGLPVMSYWDNVNNYLKVLHCGNVACTAGNTVTTVDATNPGGEDNSITIGADGLPIVSYYDRSNRYLKVLHCGNIACSAGNTVTAVDATNPGGEYNSITIGSDGLPIISHLYPPTGEVMVLHCGNAACTAGNTIAPIGHPLPGSGFAEYTSITIGGDGLPVISVSGSPGRDLYVLHCGNVACTADNTATLVDSAEAQGFENSITTGADGLPIVTYYDYSASDLKVLHCGDAACSAGNTITTVDSVESTGRESSVTIGVDGLPVVSYQDVTNADLKVLHCGNAACTAGNTVSTLDSAGPVGQTSSITIGTDGLPVIAYWDGGNADLKVLHCSNDLCVPYWRRR